MSEEYSRERAITARIIDKHLRRIVAEVVWKGYPPNFLAGKVVDVGGVQFLLTAPSSGGAGALCVDNKGTRETVAENPSFIGPAKTALVLLREHVDGLPPLPRCTARLSKDNLARLRTVVNDARHAAAPLFRLLYHPATPLGTGNGGVYELVLKKSDANEAGYVETLMTLLASRGSVDEPILSMAQIYSVYHVLSMLALLEENELLVREYGKSISFRHEAGDPPDLNEIRDVLTDRYWKEAIGDISLLTHAQQYEFFDNIGRYFNDPAEDRPLEIEKSSVDIALTALPGNPVDRSTYYAETGSALKNLRLGKLKSWTGVLETISATLGTADRMQRSLAPFIRFTTFAEIPDPAGGPSIASWGGMIDSTPVLFPIKLLAAIRDRLSGRDGGWPSFIGSIKEYPLKIARAKLKAVEEAMTSGANSEFARIMKGEKTKKATERKEVAAERKKAMDALKKIAAGLEEGLTEVLSLKWPHGLTEFSIPFAFSGSCCVISGEVSHYAPETKPYELKFGFGHITVLASRAAKCESIMKRLLDNGDVAEHINQAAGGAAPTSVCPPLAAAINDPAGFVDAFHAAVNVFVEQELASAFSVKEQYRNALSKHFPEDMLEEYCSPAPGM